MITKFFLMSALIVGSASIAYAQDAAAPAAAPATAPAAAPAPPAADVPLCSKTVTDKCMNRTAAPNTMGMHHHKMVKHHHKMAMHHHAKVVKKTVTTTTKTGS